MLFCLLVCLFVFDVCLVGWLLLFCFVVVVVVVVLGGCLVLFGFVCFVCLFVFDST